jgi:AcrR family transcriptional regulator
MRLYDAADRVVARGDAPTVTVIAVEAGVSRASFYAHFSSIDDLAIRMHDDALAGIAAQAAADDATHDVDAMLQSQRRLVAHYAQHRALYRTVLSLPAAGEAASHAADAIATTIAARIEEVASPPAGIDPALAATYIASAATGLIVAWVLGEVSADEETIARHLLELMPAWMHTASAR